MYEDIFDSIYGLLKFFVYLSIIFVPLGVWKLIDIIVYLSHHISITLK